MQCQVKSDRRKETVSNVRERLPSWVDTIHPGRRDFEGAYVIQADRPPGFLLPLDGLDRTPGRATRFGELAGASARGRWRVI